VFALCSALADAAAFKPLQLDPSWRDEVKTSADIDHLQPVPGTFGPLPEYRYLLQYWARITDEDHHYLVVIRDKTDGRYYVEEGDAPKVDLHGRPYRFKHRIEISSATAKLIYEYWVNMLLETRYAPEKMPYMPHVTLYIFSALGPAGWMHGYTEYPGVSPKMPPYWLCEAGEVLYSFVTDTKRDEAKLSTEISAHRDHFYDYMKTKEATR
jgi:hypothetical protein